MKFTVFFEIYGKKMKVEIEARDKELAKEKVRCNIIFHKIESKDDLDILDMLNGIFGIKK